MHASTQMTLTSAECIAHGGVAGVRARGAAPRAVDRARSPRSAGRPPWPGGVRPRGPLHGLLRAVPGQHGLGGRRANRGQCAQACRMPYELVCDGRAVDLGAAEYLLSPQDLAAYDLLPELIAAGVAALKIEGRLKTADYVANITRYYRARRSRRPLAGRPVEIAPRQVEEMEVSFSRGFSHGWLEGCDHKALVPGDARRSAACSLGEVRAVRGDRAWSSWSARSAAATAWSSRATAAKKPRRGPRVRGLPAGPPLVEGTVERRAGRADVRPRRDSISGSSPGQDGLEDRRSAASPGGCARPISGGPHPRRVPLNLVVEARAWAPLRITGRAASGATCADRRLRWKKPSSIRSPNRCSASSSAGWAARATTAHLEARIEGRPMVPLSVLGKLRHGDGREFGRRLAQPLPRPLAAGSVLAALRATLPRPGPLWARPSRADCDCNSCRRHKCAAGTGATTWTSQRDRCATSRPRLHVLCRSLGATGGRAGVRPCERDRRFPGPIRQLRSGRGAAHARRRADFVWPRRESRSRARWSIFRMLAGCGADGILVRNLGGLAVLRAAAGGAGRGRLLAQCDQRAGGPTGCSSRCGPGDGLL